MGDLEDLAKELSRADRALRLLSELRAVQHEYKHELGEAYEKDKFTTPTPPAGDGPAVRKVKDDFIIAVDRILGY